MQITYSQNSQDIHCGYEQRNKIDQSEASGVTHGKRIIKQ